MIKYIKIGIALLILIGVIYIGFIMLVVAKPRFEGYANRTEFDSE